VYEIKVERRLSEEEARAKFCLHPVTGPKMCAIIEKELLQAHIKSIIEVGIT